MTSAKLCRAGRIFVQSGRIFMHQLGGNNAVDESSVVFSEL